MFNMCPKESSNKYYKQCTFDEGHKYKRSSSFNDRYKKNRSTNKQNKHTSNKKRASQPSYSSNHDRYLNEILQIAPELRDDIEPIINFRSNSNNMYKQTPVNSPTSYYSPSHFVLYDSFSAPASFSISSGSITSDSFFDGIQSSNAF